MEIGTQSKPVALVGRNNTPGIREPLTALAACIVKRGFDVVFEAETAHDVGVTDYPALTAQEIGARADVAVGLGGDGTMLRLGRAVAPYRPALIRCYPRRLGVIPTIPPARKQ